jgi:hypothetical protein
VGNYSAKEVARIVQWHWVDSPHSWWREHTNTRAFFDRNLPKMAEQMPRKKMAKGAAAGIDDKGEESEPGHVEIEVPEDIDLRPLSLSLHKMIGDSSAPEILDHLQQLATKETDPALFVKVWHWVIALNEQGEMHKYFPRRTTAGRRHTFERATLLDSYPGFKAKYLEVRPWSEVWEIE